MSTTQEKQIESPNVDESLAEEMATMVASSEDDIVYGTVSKIQDRGGTIEITVSIPGTGQTFKELYNRPKPPFEEYEFTRLAQAYGAGLADLYTLEGTEVPCRYDDGWEIALPEPDRPRRKWVFDMLNIPAKTGIKSWVLLLVIGSYPLMAGLALLDIFACLGDSHAEVEDGSWPLAAGLLASLPWFLFSVWLLI